MLLKWFESYLSGRWSHCEIQGKSSSSRRILQGIFQGSCLSPLLFILYTNCLVTLEEEGIEAYLFADDSSLCQLLEKDDLKNQRKLTKKIGEMELYMQANHLKFNVAKSQFLVQRKGYNNTHKDLHIKMGDVIIKQSVGIKILGVTLSQDQNFKEYIMTGEKSMLYFLGQRLKILKILARHACHKSKKMLCEGLLISKLSYCIPLWSTTTKDNFKALQTLLNKALRVVCIEKRFKKFSNDELYQQLLVSWAVALA